MILVMKNVVGLIGLLVCFWACSRSDDDPNVNPDGPDGPKNATALLNDSTWYGRGKAFKVTPVVGEACSTNRFNFYVSNELPYPKGARKSAINSCIGNCNTTQYLSFEKIPLAVGTYTLTDLNACSHLPVTAANYGLIIGGDAVFASFRAEGPTSGWIQVTKADTVTNVVEGLFELTLTGPSAKTMRFRNGHFSTRVTK